MKSPLQAEQCFLKVINLEKKIQEDKYLVPYSYYELGLIARRENNMKLAHSFMETAK